MPPSATKKDSNSFLFQKISMCVLQAHDANIEVIVQLSGVNFFSIWVEENQIQVLDLATSVFTCWVISLDPCTPFFTVPTLFAMADSIVRYPRAQWVIQIRSTCVHIGFLYLLVSPFPIRVPSLPSDCHSHGTKTFSPLEDGAWSSWAKLFLLPE